MTWQGDPRTSTAAWKKLRRFILEDQAMKLCSVDGCERSVRSTKATLCEMHYTRVRRGQQIGTAEPRKYVNPTGICEVDGCDNRARGHYCRKHYTRLQRHGDTSTIKAPQPRPGDANGNWRGDNVGYSAIHMRLRSERGTPLWCGRCSTTAAGAYHWALDWTANPHVRIDPGNGLPYSTDLDDYVRLCVSCHKDMDLRRSA